jgi:hypothetical protein
METIKKLKVYSLLLIMAITLSNCKKKDTPAPTPAPVITNYVVKFQVSFINSTATSVHNSVIMSNGSLQYSFSDVNESTIYEFSISGKTGDYISIDATNYSTPGNCRVMSYIYTNGSLWLLASGDNNTSSPATCTIGGTLP